MTFATKRRVRARLALLMVVAMLLSLVPSTGVMAAEPHSTTTEAKVPSLRILFSASYYAKNNPDVYAAFGDNPYLLYQHYINYGIPEGRQYLSPVLDVRAYRAGNPDLEEAFGDNWEQYLWHFMNYGVYEVAAGLRAPRGVILNVTEYLRGNPDVWRMTGGNLLAAMENYVTSGMPLGSWVNAQYTAGPAIAHDSNVTSNTTSNNSNSGNNGGNGGNGGGNKPNPTPDKPTPPPTVDPDPPIVDPDDPVEHEHTKDSFNEDGSCKTEGCDYTLADFQRACKMDHSAIEIGHFCLVCGAEGTNDPTEEHTKDSLHTKNSFDENGVCARGCGLTLAEFQAACTEDHEVLHIGQICSNCNYEGTLPHAKDECPNKENHEYGEDCDLCDYAGECQEDHSAIYTTKTCKVCGEHGTKICDVDHAEIFEGMFCEECGAEGTKERPEICENEANHGALHDGQNCPGCGYAGEVDHAWDKDNHENVLNTDTCSTCGGAGTKEPPHAHDWSDKDGVCKTCGEACKEAHVAGEECRICGYTKPADRICTEADHAKVACGSKCPNCDYTASAHNYSGGVCTRCDTQCSNWDNHAELKCGAKCADCDYTDPVGHQYENGQCKVCGTHCTIEDCPDKDGHADIACGSTCTTCGTAMPGHSYTETDGAWICTRCGGTCPHSFHEGACSWCGATCATETCPNAESHDDLQVGEKCLACNYVKSEGEKPTEHVHDWENGTCKGEGECSGCDNASGHDDIVKGEACGTCGLPGEKVVAYTSDNCPNRDNHADTEGYSCDTCGYKAKTESGTEGGEGTGESGTDAGEDPTKDGTTGGTAGGGNSGDEDGAEGANGLPDALPAEIVVADDTKLEIEPDPDDGDEEDETTGGDDNNEDEQQDSDAENTDKEAATS